jgi:hemolysin activation/secretion protein
VPVAKGLTLAHRTGAATNVGDYEFYQANYIGGNENLRGYWRTRFAGQTSFYQNTELRLQLLTLKGYVFRGLVGVYGFFDDGRVWVKNDNSDKIHTGYGGGAYFMPYNKVTIDLSFAMSTEVNVFTVRTGFFF